METKETMTEVVDLFCGMGGFSLGFCNEGFDVIGYDINKHTPSIYKINKIGKSKIRDLSKQSIDEEAPSIIIGGPPCKPWSSVNITRRGSAHPDYGLITQYFKIINMKKPSIFIMENVPQVKNDHNYKKNIRKLSKYYDLDNFIVKYSDYGAATNRSRLITAGFRESTFKDFTSNLCKHKKPPKTVHEVISEYEKIKECQIPDHEWAHFKTIRKYTKYYRSGQYGWYRLNYNQPAPSFGNVMKTYTLHPKADIFGTCDDWLRVLSVREVMSIMGFPADYRFPEKMGHTVKYQMIADVISPLFSRACANTIKGLIE